MSYIFYLNKYWIKKLIYLFYNFLWIKRILILPPSISGVKELLIALVRFIKVVLKMPQLSFQLVVFHRLISQLFIKLIIKEHLEQVKKDFIINKMLPLSTQATIKILVPFNQEKVKLNLIIIDKVKMHLFLNRKDNGLDVLRLQAQHIIIKNRKAKIQRILENVLQDKWEKK